ncbi:MAG: tetratricopeptide repeat protein [Victivallales bacterium]|nr:tetratricopeptide repeat protein [Victivallales bacterium]
MANKDKEDSFSFDNDPGKLTDKSDVEFTFSDIPVLGASEDKKSFSFDQLAGEDAAIASFEEMLKEPVHSETAEGDEQSAEEDVEGVILARKAKKKKQLMVRIAVAAGALLVLLSVAGVTYYLLAQSQAKADAELKKLSPEERQALEAQKQREKINSMVGAADTAYNSDDLESAQTQYQAVLELEPNNAAALTGQAMCLLRKGGTQEAEDAFRKAMDQPGADYRPFEGLAQIFSGRGDTEGCITILEAAMEKFPGENSILLPLADSYHAINSRVKALDTYKKIPRQFFSEASLRNFAELMKLESKDEAKKLFLYMANKYGGLYPFERAASLAEDSKDKILILSEAVTALKDDESNMDNARFLLAEAFLESKENAQAASSIKGVNVTRLKPEYRSRIIVLAKQSGLDDMKAFFRAVVQASPDNLELQKSILEQARLNLDPGFVREFYSEWWSENQNNAVANYLFAKSSGFSPSARRHYEAALDIDPDMYDASFELGKIAMAEKNWSEAAKAFEHCAKTLADDKNARFYVALVAIKNGGGSAPIEEYREFLESIGYDKSQVALEIIDLALLLDSPALADSCLKIISEEPSMEDQYRLFKAKKHLLFKSKDGDGGDIFSHSPKTGLYREYCIMDMLSRGQGREVLLMTTPAEDFPEFWKVFLLRRMNLKNWEKSAELLREKEKHAADPTYKIIASLWLGLISLDDAEKSFHYVPFDKEALLYFVLAEEYRRLNQIESARIRYRKAQDCGRNVYSGVVDFYSRQIQ